MGLMGISHRSRHYPSQLSGGQQQRAAIARAVVSRPGLVLADEPTGNLDSATGDKVIELLFGLNKKQGVTLIIVTHDEDHAKLCDRQIRIMDGRIVEGLEDNSHGEWVDGKWKMKAKAEA